MRVAIYARVSTRDKGQDPADQIEQLRSYVLIRGWELVLERVDQAAAGDLARRTGWRAVVEAARRRRVDMVLVVRLDRAFRSTVDALSTLRDLEHAGVGFLAIAQPELDTTSPAGRLVFTVLAACAELERALIAERVRDGMAAAARKGKRIGRPRASSNPELRRRWSTLAPLVDDGSLTRTAAAAQLGVSRATVRELIRETSGRT